MVRFGICGCGAFMQKAVLPMMDRIDAIQIGAAYDTNRSLLDKFCDNHVIERACTSYEELLAVENIDVIYVASPNLFHKEQVIAAAASGKHVFCQKPMGINADECVEMVDACRKANVQLGMGFCYRFQGAQQLAKSMIARGEIGEVSHIHFSFNLGGFSRETVGWRCERSLSGGGPLMDISPHLVDLASHLLEDRIESVMAYVKVGKNEDDVETDAIAMMQYSKGVTVSFDTSFVRRNEHHYKITGTLGEITATGTMSWFSGGKLSLYRDGETQNLTFPGDEHIQLELQLYCDALEKGHPVPVPGEAGLEVQKAIDAIYISGRTGKRCFVA